MKVAYYCPEKLNESNCIINISVACKDLPRSNDVQDFFCVMSQVGSNESWFEVERTEIIRNDPSPRWISMFKAHYIFELIQPLRFSVYRGTQDGNSLKKSEEMGYCEICIANMIQNSYETHTKSLYNQKTNQSNGSLDINIFHKGAENGSVDGVVELKDIKKMRKFSKNRPFYMISKITEGGSRVPVYRSPLVDRVTSCVFPPFSVSVSTLCGGELFNPLAFEFYDYHEKEAPTLIGTTVTSLNEMLNSVSKMFDILDESRKICGQFKISECSIAKNAATFLEFIRGGLQINLITAIDFTGSNGNPRNNDSLHYDGRNGSLYEQVIKAVGSIVCPYDSDQMFPAFLFGGYVNGETNHCYPLNGNVGDPEVQGLDGIISVYRSAIKRYDLSGPTYFHHVIQNASIMAERSWNESKTYTILLILTDGEINDMQETIDCVVDASMKPLSIIIVGIGGANFDKMVILDADDNPLVSSNGVKMGRDIVQFVSYRDFGKQGPQALSEEVLEEVPTQVCEFANHVGFVPF